MKILFIARTCPFPANDGEKIRVFNLIKNLSQHEITIVYRSMTDDDLEGIDELSKYCKSVNPVHIPSPRTFFRKLQWIMPFIFSKYPISMATVYFKSIMDTIQDICNKEKFDIIQIEHSSLTIYLDRLKLENKPKTILTLHNIDYVRNDRLIENMSPGIEKIYQVYNQVKFKKWEQRAISKYNCVITMSDIDKKIIMHDIPNKNIIVVPNGVDTSLMTLDPNRVVSKNRNNIVFVASMDSESNHDGAIFYINEILPVVKKLCPKAVTYFVGRSPKPELLNKHNGNDIIVTGKVATITEYYEMARVAIVPLRSGGGTRLKILEAMAAGVPVVSTSIGAEGINIISGEDILLSDKPDDFAKNIVKLLTDDSLHENIMLNARKKVENEYDWSIIAKIQDSIYQSFQ